MTLNPWRALREVRGQLATLESALRFMEGGLTQACDERDALKTENAELKGWVKALRRRVVVIEAAERMRLGDRHRTV